MMTDAYGIARRLTILVTSVGFTHIKESRNTLGYWNTDSWQAHDTFPFYIVERQKPTTTIVVRNKQ